MIVSPDETVCVAEIVTVPVLPLYVPKAVIVGVPEIPVPAIDCPNVTVPDSVAEIVIVVVAIVAVMVAPAPLWRTTLPGLTDVLAGHGVTALQPTVPGVEPLVGDAVFVELSSTYHAGIAAYGKV